MATEQAEEAGGSATPRPDMAIDTATPSRGTQKVELDLDDAPFLEDEEEPAPPPPKAAPQVEIDGDKKSEDPKPGLSKKKKLILMGGAALLVLIAAAVAAKIFLFSGGDQAPKEEKPAAKEAATADNASEAKPPEGPAVVVKLEPFWVEQKGQGDEVRFLIVRMNLTSEDKTVVQELQTKLLPIRNAVFYYLKNKDVQFLADEQNADKLKSELLLVVNQYMDTGKFDAVMFEEYVVK